MIQIENENVIPLMSHEKARAEKVGLPREAEDEKLPPHPRLLHLLKEALPLIEEDSRPLIEGSRLHREGHHLEEIHHKEDNHLHQRKENRHHKEKYRLIEEEVRHHHKEDNHRPIEEDSHPHLLIEERRHHKEEYRPTEEEVRHHHKEDNHRPIEEEHLHYLHHLPLRAPQPEDHHLHLLRRPHLLEVPLLSEKTSEELLLHEAVCPHKEDNPLLLEEDLRHHKEECRPIEEEMLHLPEEARHHEEARHRKEECRPIEEEMLHLPEEARHHEEILEGKCPLLVEEVPPIE
jgi:hypothetical protein